MYKLWGVFGIFTLLMLGANLYMTGIILQNDHKALRVFSYLSSIFCYLCMQILAKDLQDLTILEGLLP